MRASFVIETDFSRKRMFGRNRDWNPRINFFN